MLPESNFRKAGNPNKPSGGVDNTLSRIATSKAMWIILYRELNKLIEQQPYLVLKILLRNVELLFFLAHSFGG